MHGRTLAGADMCSFGSVLAVGSSWLTTASAASSAATAVKATVTRAIDSVSTAPLGVLAMPGTVRGTPSDSRPVSLRSAESQREPYVQ
jgi:hypothetical protein